MLPRLIARSCLVLMAVTVTVSFVSCVTVNRRNREEALTGKLAGLLPEGRIFSHDLASDRELSMRNAWLFGPQLVVEDTHGRLTSLDSHDLSAQWYYARLPGPLDFAPAPTPISLVMISDGMLYEIDRRFGTHRAGPYDLRFVPSAGPAASGSTAYVPSLMGEEGNLTLVTINLATGLSGWGVATRGSIACAPVLGGSATRPAIYFVTETKGVFSYPAESSAAPAPEPSWVRGTHGQNLVSPTIRDDLLLVGDDKGNLWALNRVTGGVDWVQYGDGGKPITRSAWISGDQVYFTRGNAFYAVDRDNGKILWSLPMSGDFVVRREEGVYVRTDDGVVHAVDATSGEVMRSVKFGRGTHFPANMDGTTFYMVSANGFVFAVDVPLK